VFTLQLQLAGALHHVFLAWDVRCSCCCLHVGVHFFLFLLAAAHRCLYCVSTHCCRCFLTWLVAFSVFMLVFQVRTSVNVWQGDNFKVRTVS
jgi:hypothetical protein